MAEKGLSSVETELYDRQIRLWGIESQERLRAANVLLIGVRGLGSEIAKNLVLSGINSLTILDDGIVNPEDLSTNFLLTSDSLGEKISESAIIKAQTLNPLVKLTADTDSVNCKNEFFFTKFTIVISTRLGTEQLLLISSWCRNKNIQFICGDVFGLFGFMVSDLQIHKYHEDRIIMPKSRKRSHDGKLPKKMEPETVKLQGTLEFPSLSSVIDIAKLEPKGRRRNVFYYLMLVLLEFRNKFKGDPSYSEKEKDLVKLQEIRDNILKKFNVPVEKLEDEILELVFGEIVPICSVVGGVISQEVIKAVSGKEVPIYNVFLLNPLTYYGKEETVSNL